MIRVITDARPELNELRVWIIDLHERDGYVLRMGPPQQPDSFPWQRTHWDPISREATNSEPRLVDTEPTYRFDVDHLAALVTALSEHEGPSDATRTHLTDTIKIRDRLLTLIERGWGDAGGTTTTTHVR